MRKEEREEMGREARLSLISSFEDEVTKYKKKSRVQYAQQYNSSHIFFSILGLRYF